MPRALSSSSNCVPAGDISPSPGTTTADEMIIAMHQNAYHAAPSSCNSLSTDQFALGLPYISGIKYADGGAVAIRLSSNA
jgi:hypothetical protein